MTDWLEKQIDDQQKRQLGEVSKNVDCEFVEIDPEILKAIEN